MLLVRTEGADKRLEPFVRDGMTDLGRLKVVAVTSLGAHEAGTLPGIAEAETHSSIAEIFLFLLRDESLSVQ
jgi:hypothetical protein